MSIEWALGATRDLARIFEFNEGFGETYARRVDRRLIERADKLQITPRIGRPIKGTDFRRLSLPDIQYVMIYAVTRNGIRIVSIHHTREDTESR